MASANPLLGGFVSLGEALAQDAGALFQKSQGILTPAPKPVSSSGFSFNFGDAFNSLGNTVKGFFDPVTAAKNQTASSLGGAASSVIKAAGNVASDLISSAGKSLVNALQNQNKKTDPVTTLVPTVTNPQPANTLSGFDLAGVLSLLASNKSTPSNSVAPAPDPLATAAASNAQTNVLLVGGALIIGAFLLTAKGRK